METSQITKPITREDIVALIESMDFFDQEKRDTFLDQILHIPDSALDQAFHFVSHALQDYNTEKSRLDTELMQQVNTISKQIDQDMKQANKLVEEELKKEDMSDGEQMLGTL